MRKNRLALRRTICISVLLLTIFSSYFLAKYVSSFSGNDDAGVAKWSVDYTSAIDTLNLVSGNNTGDFVLNVTSTSAVSASYSIVISNAPSGMEVKVDDGEYETIGASGSISFDNVGSFSANDTNSTHTHTVVFNAPLDSEMPSVNSVNVDVIFVQKD